MLEHDTNYVSSARYEAAQMLCERVSCVLLRFAALRLECTQPCQWLRRRRCAHSYTSRCEPGSTSAERRHHFATVVCKAGSPL